MDRQGTRRPGWALPGTTLQPRWLETPVPPCCALDIADQVSQRGEWIMDRVAAAVGVKKSQAYEILASGLRKLAENGLDLSEFLEGQPVSKTG